MSSLNSKFNINEFIKYLNSGIMLDSIKGHYKDDNTLVTNVDIYINDAFHLFCQKNNINTPIISEENISSWRTNGLFPCFVIDPVDGTKELAQGRSDWSVSIAYLNSSRVDDPLSFGWVYQLTKDRLFSSSTAITNKARPGEAPKLLVSRTEFSTGIFEGVSSHFNIDVAEMGSIALKLGNLVSGDCDLVITARPKSLWDIAAGVIMLAQSDGHFYQGLPAQQISTFQDELTYNSPMLFGRDEFVELGVDIVNYISKKDRT